MNGLFQIAYAIGLGTWIWLDYHKAKETKLSRITFWLVNLASFVLFIALIFNVRPILPTTFINNTLTGWAKAIIGGIMYVQTGA